MKTLKYYLNLPYKILIEPIKEEEGGGFLARLPQFGMSITGDGETAEEAIEMLEEYKKIAFERFFSEGKQIPEPEDELSLDDYSGKILLRVPKELHQSIAEQARINNVSQNQYLNYLITAGISAKAIEERIQSFFTTISNEEACKDTKWERLAIYKKTQEIPEPSYAEGYCAA